MSRLTTREFSALKHKALELQKEFDAFANSELNEFLSTKLYFELNDAINSLIDEIYAEYNVKHDLRDIYGW